ncbi:hypothetical protein [Mucilaginibacter segetis]|uniref:Uncharacterized protein n=1 Tax=Mucilaginibacter segetis TaxID=2793071 RepID=A0A934UND9_9SPHI|nr:hypothetical protein [Mucilaginibacter segetis]MBK0380319.1 hypothetical protein [Mucilaginibacter segetis]
MNSIEEKLWNYIDGNCSIDEHKAIATLIANNEAYKSKYNELLLLNNEFTGMEMDEPPMAFTYKVMETIRTENARQPLKAAIDTRIILGISAFFIITVAALLVFAFSTVNWTAGTTIKTPELIKLPAIKSYFTGPLIKGFLFFDLVMGLFLLDNYLRKKSGLKHH